MLVRRADRHAEAFGANRIAAVIVDAQPLAADRVTTRLGTEIAVCNHVLVDVEGPAERLKVLADLSLMNSTPTICLPSFGASQADAALGDAQEVVYEDKLAALHEEGVAAKSASLE
jgi:hypothetical protein